MPNATDAHSSAALAAAFGWSATDLRSVRLQRGGTAVDIQKSAICGEPAAVFGVVRARNGYDPIDSSALYAYHGAAPWGVVADSDGLTVFSSQWIADSDWFRLPKILWSDVSQHESILRAFTPDGMLDQQVARIAASIREPSALLKPVDDALVERLDRWREQALRYARNVERVDDLLQTYYAQLFVLRTVEDRGLDAKVGPASAVRVGADRFDRNAWSDLLERARNHIGSDLFNDDVSVSIPEHVLSGVIDDLYRPTKIPGSHPIYNFAWIDADVLGLAYEKYLATVLSPTSSATQADLFLPPERTVERYSVRKSAGAYYTPKYITDFLATTCVDSFFKNVPSDTTLPYVIDFACGSGSFLVAAIDKIIKRLKTVDPHRHWARELVDGGHIVGIDIDSKAVTAARLHLWQRLIEEEGALPLPNLSSVVISANGLDVTSWGSLNRRYDIVLGNPPFLATSLVGTREELEARFQTARGRYDFSSLFIEQALAVLVDGGSLGLVVPNRLFRNRSGAPVRRLLCEQSELNAIVDFGATRPFDADAYVGCVIATKRDQSFQRPSEITVIEVKELTSDFIAALLLQAVQDEDGIQSNFLKRFRARHPSGEGPWVLLSKEEQRSRIEIEDSSVRLDTIAAIPQGIRTGANDFFIVELISDDGGALSRVVNGLGDEFNIESSILEPAIYGSQVKRYEIVSSRTRLIYPYRSNVPISEAELNHRFPHAWMYFSRNRDILSARGSLKKTGGRFYELVWPRDESWLRRPKLMIRDLAPATAFAIDPSGEVFLVGGTAVVPQDSDLVMPLMAYLNSSAINHLVRQTTPMFRGSFQKFEPQHIQGIPIIDAILEDDDVLERLRHLAEQMISAGGDYDRSRSIEAEIDELVVRIARARGISLSVS